MWLKFVVMWRAFRLWAALDGVIAPENLPACVSRQYTLSGFWRCWHSSFNRWLVRYVYLPLGGRGSGRLARWRNLCVVFGFVALWHDVSPKLLAWGGLLPLFFAPELAAEARRSTRPAPCTLHPAPAPCTRTLHPHPAPAPCTRTLHPHPAPAPCTLTHTRHSPPAHIHHSTFPPTFPPHLAPLPAAPPPPRPATSARALAMARAARPMPSHADRCRCAHRRWRAAGRTDGSTGPIVTLSRSAVRATS